MEFSEQGEKVEMKSIRKMVRPFVKDWAKDFKYLTSISKKRIKRNEGRKSSNKRTKILTSKDKNL